MDIQSIQQNLRKIKRLSVDFWHREVFADSPSVEDLVGITFIEPVFHKAGWYYSRINKFSWVEDGKKAFTTDKLVGFFVYEMKIYDHVPLTSEMRKSINCLKREHKADRKLRNLLNTDTEYWSLQAIQRGIEMHIDWPTQRIWFESRDKYAKEWKKKYETKRGMK